MAVPLEQFVKQLEESGILAGNTLKDFIPPKATPKDAEELARELVRKKKLTKFQAEEVYRGKGKSLVLGNYVLMEKIGAGGMGQVFKAEHRRLKRVVAVKLLPAAMTSDKAAIARFEREVEAAAKLRHPNIVAADDADQANGVHFLVMEFVEGSDLSALVKKDGPLPIAKAVNYILQAARGLEAAHKKGIVHRDIKPANLLLDKAGTVKILDMGLARLSDGNTAADLTSSGTVLGTVDFMAPEQALNTKTADSRADIYSLGCTLYYLLTGKAAYDGDTLMAKLLAHREQPIPSLRPARAEVPEPLETIFKKMLAKKVKDRYQTMTEVVAALESLPPTVNSEAATAWVPTAEERKQLGKAGAPKPLAPLVQVASEKSKHLIAKFAGGAFATIIAPILVTFLIKYLERDTSPPIPSNTATSPDLAAEAADDLATQPISTTSPASQITGYTTPAFQQWVNDVAVMPAQKQVKAVAKKLQDLNPGFDGNVFGRNGKSTPKIEKGVVTELLFSTENVIDISPVRALAGLTYLKFEARIGQGKVTDLSPLQGMNLTTLICSHNPVSTVAPLQGMKLTFLNIDRTKVFDLSPLRGMPLTTLNFSTTKVSDLSALKGMPLDSLHFYNTRVSDLTSLEGMSLTSLNCGITKVTNLSPLKGMALTTLICHGTRISNLSPLQDCKRLKLLRVYRTKVTPVGVAALQQALPDCKIDWDDPAKAEP